MLKKAVQQGRRRVQEPEAYPLGYVEDLNDARTTLADFFSILLLRKGELGELSLLEPLLHQSRQYRTSVRPSECRRVWFSCWGAVG